MEFGKLSNISNVDFTLPLTHSFTHRVLTKKSNTPKIHFGCTGWGMPQWTGKYYPKTAKPKSFLTHYGKQFTTIELNTTHYRIPDFDTIERWYEETPSDFVFAPKIPQIISHSSDLGLGEKATQQFCTSISGLKEKLGTTFMQLPESFGADKLPILNSFLEKFPLDRIPLAIEIRHQNLIKNTIDFNKYLELLHHFDVSTVITDVSGRRDMLHQALTTPKLLLRFVGNGLHSTDYKRVDDWIQLIIKWLDNGLEEVYFFSHQPDNILSPEMCIYFIEELEAHSTYRFKRKPSKFDDGQLTLF